MGSDPVALARDSAGDLFVVDRTAGRVARFGADGNVNASFLVGLTSPQSIYVDVFDNLYIAQGGAAHNVVEFYASGGQRVVSGSGNVVDANGTAASAAQFVSPTAVYLNPNGVAYIADGHRVYAIDTAGIIHFVAGNGTTTSTDPSTPLGTALIGPTSLAVDAGGDVFITDTPANIVYVVFATGSQQLTGAPILGIGAPASSGDGGSSNLAAVNGPLGMGVDSSGNTYVIDSGSSSLRKITYPFPTINFGTVLIGATSPTLSATAWSTGTDAFVQTSPITIDNPNFLLDSSSDVTNCGASLVAGGICELGFIFQPTAHGAQLGHADIANNSYRTPAIVTLMGNSSPPGPLNFNLPPEIERYGDAFPELVTLALSGTAPTGTITFSTGTQILCTFTGTMTATNTCSAANSGLSVATYPVTFTYSGDANYAPLTATTQLTVIPQPTATTITTTAASVVAGNPVTLTSTVTSALGPVTVGSVTFTDGSTTLGTGTLNSTGVATLTTTALAIGGHTITATYPGTQNFTSSSANLTESIAAPPGAFTIAATPPSQFVRAPGAATWQVTVTPSGGFAGPVALTCSGLPADATCTFAQGTVTLVQATPSTTTMTTSVTPNDAALRLPAGGADPDSPEVQLGRVVMLPFQLSACCWPPSAVVSGYPRASTFASSPSSASASCAQPAATASTPRSRPTPLP